MTCRSASEPVHLEFTPICVIFIPSGKPPQQVVLSLLFHESRRFHLGFGMSGQVLAALATGLVLGGAYAVAGFVMSKRALASKKKFVLWVVGGTLGRMSLALAAVALITVLLPLHEVVFLTTFLVIFFAGLVTEVLVLHRA